MGSTYLSMHYHLVFGTKERRPFIQPQWRPRLHEYLGGTVRGLGGVAESVGGVKDHVHLLCGLRATHCLADFMRELKKASSIWTAENCEPDFAWQEGYAAFTVSTTNCEGVKKYIAHQEEHHRQTDYRADPVELLQRAGVEYQPDYLP